MIVNQLDQVRLNLTQQNLNKFLSLRHINKYPFNLNSKLKDNIIETKKEIELEYKKDYTNSIIYNIKDDKNIKKGKGNVTIYIY